MPSSSIRPSMTCCKPTPQGHRHIGTDRLVRRHRIFNFSDRLGHRRNFLRHGRRLFRPHQDPHSDHFDLCDFHGLAALAQDWWHLAIYRFLTALGSAGSGPRVLLSWRKHGRRIKRAAAGILQSAWAARFFPCGHLQFAVARLRVARAVSGGRVARLRRLAGALVGEGTGTLGPCAWPCAQAGLRASHLAISSRHSAAAPWSVDLRVRGRVRTVGRHQLGADPGPRHARSSRTGLPH